MAAYGPLFAACLGARRLMVDRERRRLRVSGSAVRADPAAHWELLTPAARRSGPWLFCDTDALATCVWQERYLGRSTPAVEAIAASRGYNLYLLTDCDVVRAGRHARRRARPRVDD